MTLEDNIIAVLNDAAAQIRANMETKDINASHRTERSLRVEQTPDSIALVIGGDKTAPLSTLEVGRPGGGVPGGFRTMLNGKQDVSNTFKAILVQWARDKGIADFGWGQATVLGRKIAREGTYRHKNPVDVYSTVINETVQKLNSIIGLHVAGQISETANTNF